MVMRDLYVRFRFKPIYNRSENLKFIQHNEVWISVHKDAFLVGVNFISEAAYEQAWFERNPKIFKMIRTNDKSIAKKIAKHEIHSIAFLAKEILNGNTLILSHEKIFSIED